MSRLVTLLLALLGAAPPGVPLAAAAASHVRQRPGPPSSVCLRYEPDTVRLTGRLTRHVFFGAPGFGDDPAHDEREAGFYLELRAPVCTRERPGSDINDARAGVRRIQLVLDSAGYAALRPALGRRVTLRGTLFASHTGHHHAPLLLTVLTPVHLESGGSRAGGLTTR